MGEVLGIPEVPKPLDLARRGGCWFGHCDLKIHVGVETDFRKARPALQVLDLPSLVERLRAGGNIAREDEPLTGFHRVYVDDPFCNRVELMESRTGVESPTAAARRTRCSLRAPDVPLLSRN
jgi:hypothetical protein